MPQTCYRCTADVDYGLLVCPACGSPEFGTGYAQPDPDLLEGLRGSHAPLPWPFSGALECFSDGGILGLFGGPGSGKTALSAVLGPDYWLSTEQKVRQATSSIVWAQGGRLRKRPQIHQIDGYENFEGVIATRCLGAGLLVLDSVTRIGGLMAQTRALELVESWAREIPGRRAVAVMQVNAEGEPAGLRQNEHLTTAIAGVEVEDSGLRRLTVRKNREGGLGSAYFDLGPEGLTNPKFPYSYSVEGKVGRYYLAPYPPSPSARPRFAGLLADYFESRELKAGLASAGRVAFGYKGNRLLPKDHAQRRTFAEAHGLRWLDHKPTPKE